MRTQAPEVKVQYDRPHLYPLQLAAIFAPERFSVIEASTKSGKTVGCLVWIVEQAFPLKAGHNVWWVAPVYPQAKVAYRRLKRFLQAGNCGYTKNDTELTVTLFNGVNIVFKTGEKPDNLYGEDVYAVVLDEATRMREETFFAIRTTLTATRGPCRVIGNVKGRKNWAYKMARKAEAGAPGMAHFKITAQDAVDAGILQQEEIAGAKEDLPAGVFGELYMAEASDDEGNPFGLEHIKNCVQPMSQRRPVVWGWDLAKSVDYTVGVGLDEAGIMCRFQRFQKSWRETKSIIIRETGSTDAAVDSTGVGDPVLEDLQAEGRDNFHGFKFTQLSKQQLMEGLAVGIQSQKVGYPENSPEVPVQGELEMFEYVYTRTGVRYSAPEGFHDDCVCGYALAYHQLGALDPVQIFV